MIDAVWTWEMKRAVVRFLLKELVRQEKCDRGLTDMGNKAESCLVSIEGTDNTGKCNRVLMDMGNEAESCLVSVEGTGNTGEV